MWLLDRKCGSYNHTYSVFSHLPSVAYAQCTQILHFLLFIIVLCMWLPSILMNVCVYSLYTRGVPVCSSLWWHLRSVVEHRPPAQEPAEDMLRRMPRPCKSMCITLLYSTQWYTLTLCWRVGHLLLIVTEGHSTPTPPSGTTVVHLFGEQGFVCAFKTNLRACHVSTQVEYAL